MTWLITITPSGRGTKDRGFQGVEDVTFFFLSPIISSEVDGSEDRYVASILRNVKPDQLMVTRLRDPKLSSVYTHMLWEDFKSFSGQ